MSNRKITIELDDNGVVSVEADYHIDRGMGAVIAALLTLDTDTSIGDLYIGDFEGDDIIKWQVDSYRNKRFKDISADEYNEEFTKYLVRLKQLEDKIAAANKTIRDCNDVILAMDAIKEITDDHVRPTSDQIPDSHCCLTSRLTIDSKFNPIEINHPHVYTHVYGSRSQGRKEDN